MHHSELGGSFGDLGICNKSGSVQSRCSLAAGLQLPEFGNLHLTRSQLNVDKDLSMTVASGKKHGITGVVGIPITKFPIIEDPAFVVNLISTPPSLAPLLSTSHTALLI